MKKVKWLMVVMIVLSLTSISYGQSFTWTDTTSGEIGNVYTLDLFFDAGVGSAIFQANTINDPDWYIDYFGLKLDQNVAGVTSNLGAPTADWALYDNYLNTWNYVATSFAPTTLSDVAKGAQLNGDTYFWTFDFTLANNLSLTPSLHVGYFDGFAGGSQNIRFTQMSQKPDQVPEPATLFLLGVGLVGMAGVKRQFKK
jgi:hypothetical protein